jgi:hypothetical protein
MKKRSCQDCGVDISMRGLISIRCKECQKERKINRIPERHWAKTRVREKKRHDYKILFSVLGLQNLAKKIKYCRYCNHFLDYRCHQGYKKYGPSLDRINNKKGELKLSDVQIIYYQCNKSKQNRTHDELIIWCKNILKFDRGVKNETIGEKKRGGKGPL